MTPFNDGIAGLRVVKMLEAAELSVKNRGKTINFKPTGASRRPLAAIA
jgi:hypothetical protein